MKQELKDRIQSDLKHNKVLYAWGSVDDKTKKHLILMKHNFKEGFVNVLTSPSTKSNAGVLASAIAEIACADGIVEYDYIDIKLAQLLEL